MSGRGPTAEAPPPESSYVVVDPTSELLGQVRRPSRLPWISIGFLALALLWLPTLPRLASDAIRPSEAAWIDEALVPETEARVSAFARQLTRSIWEWQDLTIEPTERWSPAQRQALRLPAAGASIVALLVLLLLGRVVVGDAASVFAVSLLAVSRPWIHAGTSFSPLAYGEFLMLLGVLWAILLQARHREVSVAPVNATRVGVAGLFLGIGLLLIPAGFATLVATVLVWFLLGLRRSSSDATTLPVVRPRHNTFLAIFGTVVLLSAAVLALFTVENFAGGSRPPFLSGLSMDRPPDVDLWVELYRGVLSPTAGTDRVVVFGLLLMLSIRAIEWFGSRPWQSAGLLPWAFLGWFLFELTRPEARGLLRVPVTVPPLFLLGLAWLLLRGLHPGRARRQEYTFLLVWVLIGVLCAPLIPRGHPFEPLLAITVTLLPAVVLTAARAVRALWEWDRSVLSRTGVVVLAYAPVAAAWLSGLAERSRPLQEPARVLDASLGWILLGGVGLGLVAQITSVRPDPSGPAPNPDARHRRGRGRGGPSRRRTGRRRPQRT